MKKKIFIDGIESRYSVTDDGKVFNDKTGRELKGTYKREEYHSVQLVDSNGKPKTFMVHRLVAEAFCDNPNGYTIVDHIDRNRTNNNAFNLRWVTSKENAQNTTKVNHRRNQQYTGNYTDGDWKIAFNHENYMINIDDGTVVNINTKNILIPQDRNGYLRVNINSRQFSLHILVWESANNQKVPDSMEVDHIDGNKKNNSINNLKLTSRSDNMKNAYNNGHANAVSVKQYSLNGEYLKTYSSIREAACAVSAQEAGLKDATNRHGTCSGYYWIRENDPITIEEVMYNWIPEGYTLIKDYPTYCIDKNGNVYNKRNKTLVPIKYRADGITKYVILNQKRINIEKLLP